MKTMSLKTLKCSTELRCKLICKNFVSVMDGSKSNSLTCNHIIRFKLKKVDL